ncbi:hypothetical protein Dxin01_01159 [Deinococcus xinjiangensis]|uniref:Uncharacterized protein n=1 Tax=Deinococcus xinjiangensis TaxID=457454 RepID=A0ABP9VCJ9_9DEIO
MPDPLALVWYIELRGPEALATLGGTLDQLAALPDFLGAELLASPAQPELALLESRWAAGPPSLLLPAGAKSWTFEVKDRR